MKSKTIGRYLIGQLEDLGVGHVFGIPGDYVLGFCEQLGESALQTINSCDEQGAGFAADAYDRVRGLGVVCVTYCVGGLKVANTTAIRYGLNPIVLVLNNHGYGTERHIQDGPYNDLVLWRYHRLPEMLGAGRGFLVRTELELAEALEAAQQHTGEFCLLEIELDPMDRSPALERLTDRLRRNVS